MVVFLLIVAADAVVYGLGGFSCGGFRREGLMILALAALVFAPRCWRSRHRRRRGRACQRRVHRTRRRSEKRRRVASESKSPARAAARQVIFAWFENKKALLTWYTSETHIHAMQSVFPGHQPSATALKDIPDGHGPILTIASVTSGSIRRPQRRRAHRRSRQIVDRALRTTARRGLAVGGRFAPAGAESAGLRELTPPTTAGGGR